MDHGGCEGAFSPLLLLGLAAAVSRRASASRPRRAWSRARIVAWRQTTLPMVALGDGRVAEQRRRVGAALGLACRLEADLLQARIPRTVQDARMGNPGPTTYPKSGEGRLFTYKRAG